MGIVKILSEREWEFQGQGKKIYPDDENREILTLVREYDKRFAAALGMKIFQDEDDETYTSSHILCQYGGMILPAI